jgi:actin-related protein
MGYSGEEEPKSIFPTVVGMPQYQELIAAEVKELYYGNDAYAKRGLLNYSYPIERGTIENFDHFEKLIDYAYNNELRVEASDYPLHMTESLQTSTKCREHLLKYFFETLEVPRFYISGQALLSVYATGATTGLAIEMGDGITQIVPVSGGFTLKHASQKIDLAGRDVTSFLNDIIY